MGDLAWFLARIAGAVANMTHTHTKWLGPISTLVVVMLAQPVQADSTTTYTQDGVAVGQATVYLAGIPVTTELYEATCDVVSILTNQDTAATCTIMAAFLAASVTGAPEVETWDAKESFSHRDCSRINTQSWTLTTAPGVSSVVGSMRITYYDDEDDGLPSSWLQTGEWNYLGTTWLQDPDILSSWIDWNGGITISAYIPLTALTLEFSGDGPHAPKVEGRRDDLPCT